MDYPEMPGHSEPSSARFSSAEQVAGYLEHYANAAHKEAAIFVREQAQTIEKLQKDLKATSDSEKSYMNDDYERRCTDEYHAQNLRDACGGNDGPY